MCDTLVALPNKTASGTLLFGKNSDREPEEAQAICHFPGMVHQEKTVQCTYISIPQTERTYEVILSKPFQMWGAEMGANEHGVVIGNEAVFTNVKFDKKKIGLTGMDLLRLGLERGKTAKESLLIIIDLLQTYGQNACGGYKNKNFYYHNSFLIADPEEAFILETAGKSWAYSAVYGLGSISNGLTITDNYLDAHFEKEGRTLQALFSGSSESFKGNYSDLIYTKAGRSKERQSCTLGFLKSNKNLSVADFFSSLRQHDKEDFHPKNATTGCICMHATGFTNPSDTTGSMVAEIRKNAPSTIWLTGTPHPCMSLYLPFFFGNPAGSKWLSPGPKEDDSFWWQAKKWHQKIESTYKKHQPLIRKQLDSMQETWTEKERILLESGMKKEDFTKFTESCMREYYQFIKTFS